jgi:pimeloyl-ACP methyl ester carboxylesterase
VIGGLSLAVRPAVALVLKALAALLVAVVLASYLVPLPSSPDRDPETLVPPAADLLTVDGQRTAVVDAGPRDGPPVVLVHGFGGSTFSWRLTIPALAAAGYRAIALDLVDFGLSDKSWDADTTHPAQARRVLAVMDALGVSKAVVVGHSMGGSVATRLAIVAPNRVTALVLVDAAVTGPGEGGSLAVPIAGAALRFPPFLQVARQAVRRLVTEDRLVSILRSAYADPDFVTPDVADGYLAQIRTKDWDLGLLAVSRDVGGNVLPAPLSTLKLPVLVAWGADDPWIPLARGEALRAAIPGAHWAAIEGAGHLPFEERPEAFMTALLGFLASVSDSSRSPIRMASSSEASAR